MIKISIVIVSVSFNFYNVGTFKQNYRIIPSIFLSDDYHRSIVYCKIMRIDKTDLQIPLEESWSRNGNLIRLVFWSTLCLILLFFWIELAVFLLQSPLCTIFVHIHNLRCVPLIFYLIFFTQKHFRLSVQFITSRTSLLNRVSCLPVCQRGLRATMLACQHGLRANLPKAYQLLIFTCQRTIRHAIVSSWRAKVPNGVPIFQLGLPNWQKVCQFFDHSSYKMLRQISILYHYIKNSTIYLIS